MNRDELAQRLLDSAAALGAASAAIDALLRDRRQRTHLADDRVADPAAVATVTAFGQLLDDALAAVVDLSAHDRADREYPDLSWYEFRCANTALGKHTDVIGGNPES